MRSARTGAPAIRISRALPNGSGGIRDVVVGDLLQHSRAPRAHQRQHGEGRGHVLQADVEPGGRLRAIQLKSWVAKPVPVTM